MELKDAIRVELEKMLREATYRVQRALREVLDPLEDWAREAVSRGLAPDWREQLESHLATWEAKGYRLADESRPVLEGWIESWAAYLAPMRAQRMATVGQAEVRDHAVKLSVVTVATQRKGPVKPTQPPKQAPPPAPGPTPTLREDGLVIAGPGPETTTSFRAKVQFALELIDPATASWWKGASVAGILRSRDASSYSKFLRRNHRSYMEGDRPVVEVDQNFTAQQAAEAIQSESSNALFADSVAAAKRLYRAGRSDPARIYQEWKKQSLAEGAETASILAELYVGSLATVTPSGDLVVTAGDVLENGPRWDQLLNVLPRVSALPIGAIVLPMAGKRIRMSKAIAYKLEKLDEQTRGRLVKLLERARSDEEAAAIVRREVIGAIGDGDIHHVISAKVHRALEEHPILKGKYRYRDPRFELIAVDKSMHRGYENWHIRLDAEVSAWILDNQDATEEIFESWLRRRYNKPNLKERFPHGF